MSLADLFVLSLPATRLTRILTLLLLTAMAGVGGVLPLVRFDWLGVFASWVGLFSAMSVWWGTHERNQSFDNNDPLTMMGGRVQ